MKQLVAFFGLWLVVQACLAQSSIAYYYDKTGSSTVPARTIMTRPAVQWADR
jgi:hypothetical protein